MSSGSHGLTQAYEIRDLAAKHALELRDLPADGIEEKAARAQALRNLAQVWDTASERIRIIRGRPLPGSLRPKALPPRKGKRQVDAIPADGINYAEPAALAAPAPNGSERPTTAIQPAETVYPQPDE